MGGKTEGMPNETSQRLKSQPVGIRWWPVGVILGVMVLAMGVVQSIGEFPFQRRNLICLGIAGGAAGADDGVVAARRQAVACALGGDLFGHARRVGQQQDALGRTLAWRPPPERRSRSRATSRVPGEMSTARISAPGLRWAR